jgi:DNA-binding HxlR family transcriptional regulator
MTTQKKPIGKKRAAQNSGSDRPIMALIDLLGRRWTLRIIWELRDGEMSSRTLRAACDNASPTVLHARLSELRDAGLVELIPTSGYSLTSHGRELFNSFMPLAKFARHWGKSVAQA